MKPFTLFCLVILFIGCATVSKMPPTFNEVPWNTNEVIVDMTYKEVGQYLISEGHVLESSDSEFKQLATAYFDAKHSNYQQEIRIEGTEKNGKMYIKARYKSEVGEGYGCKCAQINEFFKAPFIEALWLFDGHVIGYDFSGERPAAKIDLF